MANDTLNFHCPSCGIFLTVPVSLAGVTGPCPSCRNQIQAPAAEPTVESQDSAPFAETLPAPTPPPVVKTPDPAAVMPDPPPVPAEVLPDIPALPATTSSIQEPAESTPKIPVSPPQKPVDPAILSIELGPRETSTATPPPTGPRETSAATPPPIVKSASEPLPAPVAESFPQRRFPQRSRSTWSARLIRILLPLLFFVLMAAAVFGILTLVSHYTKEAPTPEPVTLPAPLPDPPAPGASSATEPPPGPEAANPTGAAYEVLEKFLAAQTLAERLPLMESKTTESEMAKSCLALPFPEARNIVQDSRKAHPTKPFTDFYYHVDFIAEDQRLNPQTLLIRQRGDDPPKIVVDPFLDSFGGRLAAFAAAPNKQTELFQVIVDPLATCNDETLPHPEKKFTLKLLPRESKPEIALAYCGRQSRIGLMLENAVYELNFGKGRPCTVMLRWNSEDRPETPYLEALEIKSLDWNP